VTHIKRLNREPRAQRALQAKHWQAIEPQDAIWQADAQRSPITGIALVPSPRPDDRAIISPSGGDDRMPIIRPNLQFIPLRPVKR
jgi:hypothetical protein